ncbi:sigma-54 interaction domain-containing protein [Acidicapsa acidisoli]|uniref:sigma-54 interaction domain-containing protein n=1 Tax=Acidicapsa acidisoli TaxID=1615681 RepID=UPI0021DFB088|nr:sigma-54 dependent transcriptional regulator [Acidicapsa acidisoli]
MGGHIVLVVQNSQTHEQLIQNLAAEGTCALCFRSVEEAVAYLREPGCPASIVVFGVTMRRQSDYAAVIELGIARPELQILLTAQERSSMLDLLSGGNRAVWVLDKPLNHAESAVIVRRALKTAAAAASEGLVEALSSQNGVFLPYTDEFLRRVGMADVPVLLSGETGVGKEVMARRLRAYSLRADKPFLKLNCAALPPELAESELFGSAKGAFTGANADRQGRFETAQGGTILLDEIGDMDLRLQTKLLQVLQDGEIQPLGSNRTIKVNVRVMAATHRDLSRAIQDGTFREDLYYRLNVIKIVIPPLRERREEILTLAETLLARHLPKGQKAPLVSDELKRFLLEYRWPGNVRELENVMRRFLVYQDSAMIIRELLEGVDELRSGDSPAKMANGRDANLSTSSALTEGEAPEGLEVGRRPERVDSLDRLAEASRVAETELLMNALEANRWNRRQAAASLQIEYKAFLYKLQKYGIVESKGKQREISA